MLHCSRFAHLGSFEVQGSVGQEEGDSGAPDVADQQAAGGGLTY